MSSKKRLAVVRGINPHGTSPYCIVECDDKGPWLKEWKTGYWFVMDSVGHKQATDFERLTGIVLE